MTSGMEKGNVFHEDVGYVIQRGQSESIADVRQKRDVVEGKGAGRVSLAVVRGAGGVRVGTVALLG